MLELAGRIGLGVDVGDFLELERPLHGHRVLGTATEEQRVALLGEQRGHLFHGLVHRQRLLQVARQTPQRLDQLRLDASGQGAAHLADGQGQQQQADQLGGERLGRGHADLRTGVGQQGQVGLAHQRAGADVADRQAGQVAGRLGIAQGSQGIGGFPGLGDGDEQRVGLHRHLAVAELAGHLDLAGNAGQLFQPVAGDHAGVEAGAAGDDLHVAHLGEQLGRLRAEGLHQHVIGAQAAFQGALHHLGLLVDFLEHEVAVLALLRRLGAFVELHGVALHAAAFGIPDLHAVLADLGDVALLQIDEAVGDLAQGQRVGGQEVLAQAQTDHQRAAAARGEDAVRLRSADHRQAVGAVQLLDRRLERISQVRQALQRVVQQVDDGLGVGLRGEQVTEALEPLAQLLVVLDDAVVHHRQLLAGEVRMGVGLAGHAVGGPASMGDAQATEQRLLHQRLFQRGDLADAAAATQLAVVGVDRHAGAVVAAVFEALEALDENGTDITLGNRADNSAHAGSPCYTSAQISLMPRARICSRASASRRASVIRVWMLLHGSSRLGMRRPSLSASAMTITSRATSAMTRDRPSSSLKVVVPRARSMPSAPMNNWSKS